MFYLLEDNRIIDMNNICSQKEFIEENGKLKELTGFNLSSIGLQKFYNDVYVKNQSENVYDLIDWEEDLVRITWSDGKNFIIDCNINKSDFNDGYYSLDWITAIYKPNEKGNYIKVWEKKDG